jgi:hypothetical protein
VELKDKDLELIERGTKALINELGYSGFIKYISRVQICNGNYFRNKEVVYKNIDSKDNKEDIR